MLLEKHSIMEVWYRLQELYSRYSPEEWEWVISYSGGKDSSVLLNSVIALAEEERFDFEVLHHDTGVEYPILRDHVDKVLEQLRGRGIKIAVTKPEKSFFDYILERGYTFPRWNFRWCCMYLKWTPTSRFFEKKGKCLNLIAIRGDEVNRPTMFIRTKYNRGKRLENLIVASPLVDLSIEDVWHIIRTDDPFGVSKLYPCKNVRFGCWVCTVANCETLAYFHPELLRIKYELVCARCESLKDFTAKLEDYKDILGIKTLDVKENMQPCGRRCSICQIHRWKKRTKEKLGYLLKT